LFLEEKKITCGGDGVEFVRNFLTGVDGLVCCSICGIKNGGVDYKVIKLYLSFDYLHMIVCF